MTCQPPYTVSDKAMQMMVDIAAALERYRIVMEGANGIRLRKINHIRTAALPYPFFDRQNAFHTDE